MSTKQTQSEKITKMLPFEGWVETNTYEFPAMVAVSQICRHVVTCDENHHNTDNRLFLLSMGPFNFENRTIIEGDMTRNVQVGKDIFSTHVLEIFRPVLGMEHCLLNS